MTSSCYSPNRMKRKMRQQQQQQRRRQRYQQQQQQQQRPRKKMEEEEGGAGSGSGGEFRSWADLPDIPLDSVLRRLPSIIDHLSFSSVCRSWRSFSTSTTTSFPPLLLFPVIDDYRVPNDLGRRLGLRRQYYSRRWTKPQRYLLQTLTKQTLTPRTIPSETLTLPFLGYSCNRLIFFSPSASSSSSSSIVVADVFTGQITTVRSPPVDSLRPRTALLTETDLILAADSLVLSYRPGTDSWSRLDGAHNIISLLVFRGQIFSVDQSRGLGVIELTGTSIRWKPMELQFHGKASYGYSEPTCNKFRQRLVQCGQELLYIKFADHCFDRRIVILKLDLEKKLLLEVESLGDWCLFLDNLGSCGMACPEPGRWGGISDCVYMAWPPAVLHLDDDRSFEVEWDVELSDAIFGENFPDDFISEPNCHPIVDSFPRNRWPSPVWVCPN